jgi:hypothetical protein
MGIGAFEDHFLNEPRNHRIITYSIFLDYLVPGKKLSDERRKKKIDRYIEKYFREIKTVIFNQKKE